MGSTDAWKSLDDIAFPRYTEPVNDLNLKTFLEDFKAADAAEAGLQYPTDSGIQFTDTDGNTEKIVLDRNGVIRNGQPSLDKFILNSTVADKKAKQNIAGKAKNDIPPVTGTPPVTFPVYGVVGSRYNVHITTPYCNDNYASVWDEYNIPGPVEVRPYLSINQQSSCGPSSIWSVQIWSNGSYAYRLDMLAKGFDEKPKANISLVGGGAIAPNYVPGPEDTTTGTGSKSETGGTIVADYGGAKTNADGTPDTTRTFAVSASVEQGTGVPGDVVSLGDEDSGDVLYTRPGSGVVTGSNPRTGETRTIRPGPQSGGLDDPLASESTGDDSSVVLNSIDGKVELLKPLLDRLLRMIGGFDNLPVP